MKSKNNNIQGNEDGRAHGDLEFCRARSGPLHVRGHRTSVDWSVNAVFSNKEQRKGSKIQQGLQAYATYQDSYPVRRVNCDPSSQQTWIMASL